MIIPISALTLTDYKKRIFDYVESRMAFIAPNLSAIIGASTAAKLMGAAGGLTALSKVKLGNILDKETGKFSSFSCVK